MSKGDVLLEEVYSWVMKSDIVGGSLSTRRSNLSSVKVGDTITLKNSANRFTTGETIADHTKGSKYKIHQTKDAQVLLKSGSSYLGWVKKSDVQ